MSDRLERFLAWAQKSGARASIADRRRMASELFELAGADPVTAEHVDALVSSLRSTLAGGQAIMCAKTVGDDLVRWHGAEGAEASPPPAPVPPVAPARPAPPKRHDSLELEFDLGGSAPPAAGQPLPAPPAALSTDDLELGLPPVLQTFGSASVRPHAAMPSAPPLADPGEGLELDLLASSPPAAQRAAASVPAAPASALLESEPPPPLAAMELDVSGPAPAPSSIRQPAALADGFHAPPTTAGVSTRAFAPASSRARDASSPGRRLLLLAVAVVVGAFVAFALVVRPRFLFPDAGRLVQGTHRSKHLGLSVDLPSQWRHAEDLDDEEDAKGWERRVSVFYQGSTVTRFEGQITLMVFRKDGNGSATDDELRTVGASQTLDQVQLRNCAQATLGGRAVQRCSSYATRFNNRYVHFEHFFTLDGRIVFVRTLFATRRPVGAEVAVPLDRAQREPGQTDPEVDAMAAAADGVVASIAPFK